MLFERFQNHFSSNTEKYLPYIYPVLMPILSMLSFKVRILSFQDALIYWLFAGVLQLLLLIVIQKAIYLKSYNKPIRWLIAALLGSLVLGFYLFLEYNFLHITPRFAFPYKWAAIIRFLLNIPILIALVEGIKSAAARKRIVINNIMLKNENAKAQLNLLLQQINPHFLFNCLTILQAMARSKDTRTEDFILKMGDIYRQTVESEKGTVGLQEELNFFNSYMYLMKMRQENAIFIEMEITDEALAYQLPSFSLQLLAENCIKHNIVSETKPLTIRLYQKDAKTLTISNNYQPKTVKNESFGIGIDNLKKRYALEGIEQGVLIELNEITYSTTLKLI